MKRQTTGMIALAALVGTVVAEDDKVAAYFKTFDADGDGKLNKAESFEMTRTQLVKKGITNYETEAEKRFKNHDKDGDGFVTLEEYKIVVERLKKQQSAKSAE